MEALKAACKKLKYQSFEDFKSGEYIVKQFSLVDTKYGKRIKVELSDVYLFLPERFNSAATPEGIAELNSTPKVMIYTGKDMTNQNR